MTDVDLTNDPDEDELLDEPETGVEDDEETTDPLPVPEDED